MIELSAVLLPRLFKELDLLADILESREHFHDAQSVCPRNGERHIGRNDGRNERAVRPVRGQESLFLAAGEFIFGNEQTAHVARKRHIFPRRGILGVHAQPVCIGIGRKNDVRIHFFGKRQRIRKCRGILGIGIAQRREIPVGLRLLGHRKDLFKSELGKNARHGHISRAVERRIDNADVLCHLLNGTMFEYKRLDGGHVCVIDLFADDLEHARPLRLFLRHGAHTVVILDRIHTVNDAFIVGRHDLSAVAPVYLVTVVLRRVVARRDDNARRCMKKAHGKGELGRRAQRFK